SVAIDAAVGGEVVEDGGGAGGVAGDGVRGGGDVGGGGGVGVGRIAGGVGGDARGPELPERLGLGAVLGAEVDHHPGAREGEHVAGAGGAALAGEHAVGAGAVHGEDVVRVARDGDARGGRRVGEVVVAVGGADERVAPAGVAAEDALAALLGVAP